MAGRLSAKVYRLGQRQVRHAIQDHNGHCRWRGEHDITTTSLTIYLVRLIVGLGFAMKKKNSQELCKRDKNLFSLFYTLKYRPC